MDPFHPLLHLPPEPPLTCVCDRLLPDGPYYAVQTSEQDLLYISAQHPRCLREWGFELVPDEFGIRHSSCQEEAEEDVRPS